MKKVIAIGALCATVAGFAADTAISSDIVGYINNPLSATTANGTIDVGVSFSNIGAENGAYTIKNTIFNRAAADGDVLLIFNPTAYNYDWYQYTDDGTGNMVWMVMDTITYAMNFISSFAINNGDSVVFLPADRTDLSGVTVSGGVAELGTASRTFVIDLESTDASDKMFPITNPYPIATTKKMLDGFVVDGDVFLVWNDLAYNYDWYQYTDDGTGKMVWMVMDTINYSMVFLSNDDDIIFKAGQGAIFLPAVGGTRTWTVSSGTSN